MTQPVGQQAREQPAPLGEAVRRRPIVWAAACFVAGVGLHAALPPWSGLWLLIAAALLPLAILRQPMIACMALGVSLLAAGAAAGQLEAFFYPGSHISGFTGESPRLARVELCIEQEPRVLGGVASGRPAAPRQVAQGRVLRILTTRGWEPASGTVLLQLAEPHPRLEIRQRIEAYGLLHRPLAATNPGQYDWAGYYRQQRVLASLHVPHLQNVRILESPGANLLDRARAAARRWLQLGFSEAQSVDHALLRALVLGDGDPQLRDIQEQFVRTGTSHHLAISGMHVAVLGMFVYAICRVLFISPRRSAWAGMTLVIVYGLVALPSPPVVRSVLLCVAVGAGVLSRRATDGIHLLALSVLAMLVYDPLDLYNAGFELSFGTVLGLMIFSGDAMRLVHPPLTIEERIIRQYEQPSLPRAAARKVWRWTTEALVAGVVAWLVSAPLIALHFNQPKCQR